MKIRDVEFRGGLMKEQVKLTDLSDIGYMAKVLPLLYFKLDKNNRIKDLIIGNGYFGDYYFHNCLGKDFFDICPVQFVDSLQDAVKKSRQSEESINRNFYVKHREKTLYNEYKIVPADGEVIIFVWSEEIKKNVDYDSVNQLKHNGLLDLYPDFIAVVDYTTGQIVETNEALIKFYELEDVDLAEVYARDIIMPEYFETLDNIKLGINRGETIKDLIMDTQTFKSKKIYPMEIMIAPIFNEEKITHVFCIIRDLEQKTKLLQMKEIFVENMRLLNEAVEIEKVRTEFFSNISHEFKTPINVLIGALKLMEMYVDKVPDEQLQGKLGNLHNSMKLNCYRLLRLVSNFLDITRIETGYIKVNLINCDIVRVIHEITYSISAYALEKGVELKFISEVEQETIACDPEKIERIFLNLLSNAIKFTSKGDKIMVNLSKKDDFVVISVKDTGIGIKEEDQGYIFERFKQVNKSFSRNSEGTGIGLSLVKSLVEMHQGTISVKSAYGEGSEFIVELPNQTADEMNPYYKGMEDVNIGDRVVMEFSDIYIS